VLPSHKCTSQAEQKQIVVAQMLFLFLPSANFSLLLYLFSFFTQIPLSSENGLQFEDIACLFAWKLLGGPSKVVARRMLVWILRRWSMISDGLVSTPGKVSRLPAHRGPSHAEPSFSPPSIGAKSPPYQLKSSPSGRGEHLRDASRSPSYCRSTMPMDGYSPPVCECVLCNPSITFDSSQP
jgi:hypothetical protein